MSSKSLVCLQKVQTIHNNPMNLIISDYICSYVVASVNNEITNYRQFKLTELYLEIYLFGVLR